MVLPSLERLIIELDGELLKLDIRSNSGEDVALARRNKEEQKIRYEEEKMRLEKACQQEVTLSRKSPTLAGAIRVRPAADADASMKTAPDIERIGMEEATRYEEAQGNTVEDISAENLGFDLRSTTSDGTVRCIEVKARAGREPVVLTRNEWHKAKQLKDCLLSLRCLQRRDRAGAASHSESGRTVTERASYHGGSVSGFGFGDNGECLKQDLQD